MKIVALYKTFSGEEFVKESIDSIYDFVDNIVFVHSDISWSGERGNTVAPVVAKYRAEIDKRCKFREMWGAYKTQDEQYMAGVDFIRRELDADWIMLVDTDEVWDSVNLRRAIRSLLMDNGRSAAIATKLYTYVKDVHYRIDPPEPLMPIVFFNPEHQFKGVRGNQAFPRVDLDGVYFHHFTYVRQTPERVFAKIVTSHIGDGIECADLDIWRRDVWDRLPDVHNLHPSVGFERNWRGVVVVNDSDLPEALRCHPK